MSYFDDASLVMIPSGYKDQKVYSVKPIDGSGDLTFSRASNATRVNSSGLVERVRENLALYSQEFDNANWQKASSGTGVVPVVTANTTTAPDGTTTADTIVFNSGAGTTSSDYSTIYQLFSVSSATYTFSFYGKVASGTADIMLRLDSSQGYITKTLTTTWQRFDIKFTGASGFVEIGIRRGINEPIASSATVQLWGAMMELSDFGPTQYIATTSAAVSVGPVSGLPRLDYSGGASCPSLLLEPQRTNLYTFSEQTDNAAWGKTNASVTANNTASPDGYTNADKVVANTTNGVHRIEQDKATATQVATQSVFAKASGYNFIALENGGEIAYFNISTGVVGAVSGGTASIQDYGNGWYRCIFTATALNTKAYIYISNADNVITFAGDNTSGVFIYGAQFEAGAYATSYIPTLSSAVTRVQDSASKTGIGSLIGVNQGSIYVELDANGINSAGANYIFDLSDGTNFDQNRISMYWTDSLTLSVFYGYGGTFSSVSYTSNFATTKKVAVRWTSTQLQVVINGVAKTALTYGNSSPTKLSVAIRYNDVEPLASNVKQCLLFNNTLTESQLIQLTTI